MTIFELLDTDDYFQIDTVGPFGIFPHLSLTFLNPYLIELSNGYYLGHSSLKTVSPFVENVMNIGSALPNKERLANYISNKFGNKWERIYEALISNAYNPLNNYDYIDTKIGNNTDDVTHQRSVIRSGANIDTTEYDTDITSTRKESIKETVTTENTSKEDTFPYNTSDAIDYGKTTDNSTETTEGALEDNKTESNEVKTGTDKLTHSINNNETDGGTNNKTITIDETLTKKGRTVSAQSLIEEEIDLRKKDILFDIIYRDIDSVLTLQIY